MPFFTYFILFYDIGMLHVICELCNSWGAFEVLVPFYGFLILDIERFADSVLGKRLGIRMTFFSFDFKFQRIG